MRIQMNYVACSLLLAGLVVAGAGCERESELNCGDVFAEDGGAETATDCDDVPDLVIDATRDTAHRDALQGAEERCPEDCPPELIEVQRQLQSCKDLIFKVEVRDRFRCGSAD